MEKKYKILLVDDDADSRGIYAEVFKTSGFSVIEAVDGLDGINKAIANVPDVIFTGIIMPKMDGFGLKDALSKNVATSNIPVVMSSHMGREEDRKKADDAGVKDFFVAGMITPKEVVARVLNLFSLVKYKLKLNINAGDISRLTRELKLKDDFSCPECGEDLVLNIEMTNKERKEFTGRIICPRCDSGQTE
ncbi:MAG: response regulator [Candidatus Moranbacteria bacterium]|nr:response regulator [Candidatus Moranbacteria bacterium]